MVIVGLIMRILLILTFLFAVSALPVRAQTTDITGQGGSFAATKIHEIVRQDVLADDIRKEGRTIRRAFLKIAVRLAQIG